MVDFSPPLFTPVSTNAARAYPGDNCVFHYTVTLASQLPMRAARIPQGLQRGFFCFSLYGRFRFFTFHFGQHEYPRACPGDDCAFHYTDDSDFLLFISFSTNTPGLGDRPALIGLFFGCFCDSSEAI